MEVLKTSRYNFMDFVPTIENVKWFLFQCIPELIKHTRTQDTDQVREHYDRGNDFYEAFLGPMMIYTSGIYQSADDSLEQAQKNKMKLISEKIHMKKGDKHLDIGCGWGTFVATCAKEYGTDSTGVTLAKEQTAFGTKRIEEYGVSKSARILCMDYRDIPAAKYDKITCLEMAEHVGVRLFSTFLNQVYNLLNDDGVFYLQIAGLRRAWQYEDLLWGCFMGKYVFPGADASCPLGWVIEKCEGAGFEIRSEETIGIHYSKTLTAWYNNWVSPKNKKMIVQKYGELWWRKWAWFLSWSVISSGQGSASCYMIVMHKNTRSYDRDQYIAERAQWKI
jgi:cyclopropane fatty-acyl-phospholipid synthase-like methyltransferase